MEIELIHELSNPFRKRLKELGWARRDRSEKSNGPPRDEYEHYTYFYLKTNTSLVITISSSKIRAVTFTELKTRKSQKIVCVVYLSDPKCMEQILDHIEVVDGETQ